MQIFLFLLSITLSFTLSLGSDSCSFRYPNGQIVDLRRIGFTNNSARFSDVLPVGNVTTYHYYYNPCYKFQVGTTGNCAKGVAVCQYADNSKEYYNLGLQENFKAEFNDGKVIFTYLESMEAGSRTTLVTLICNTNGSDILEVWGETKEPKTYLMNLYTPCACPDGCLEQVQDEGLSTGSVLDIIFFVGVFFYLLGGIIYRKIVMGATGAEVIPNYEFWCDFPLLVRDGILFCTSGCQTTSYERI